jgi:hypothetical protein
LQFELRNRPRGPTAQAELFLGIYLQLMAKNHLFGN